MSKTYSNSSMLALVEPLTEIFFVTSSDIVKVTCDAAKTTTTTVPPARVADMTPSTPGGNSNTIESKSTEADNTGGARVFDSTFGDDMVGRRNGVSRHCCLSEAYGIRNLHQVLDGRNCIFSIAPLI
ncbi:hypothetical protein VDGL01_06497 [Verticillium dahliae]|nr:Endoplasmic reticulum mannosyl-oligosaccharide 1,2-alpha-mannosidase [Verticillium dahliae VDG2]